MFNVCVQKSDNEIKFRLIGSMIGLFVCHTSVRNLRSQSGCARKQNKKLLICAHLLTCMSVCIVKVRVSQLQVDGSGECGLPCATQSVHPPGLPGFRRDVDASGGQL